jgi:hypothetical protein
VPCDPDLHLEPALWSQHAPKPAPGFLRLYRGEHPTDHDSSRFGVGEAGLSGGWFTSSLDLAEAFCFGQGEAGIVVYIDVPHALARERLIDNLPAFRDRPAKCRERIYFFPERKIRAKAKDSTS